MSSDCEFLLTIDKFVYKHKVILDGFFVQFTKVRSRYGDKLIQEFKDQCRIGVVSARNQGIAQGIGNNGRTW